MSYCTSVLSLPESFCRLSSLKKLDLRGNDVVPMNLESLPKGFGQLTKLTTLWMDNTPAGRSMPAALKAQLEAQGCKSAGNGW